VKGRFTTTNSVLAAECEICTAVRLLSSYNLCSFALRGFARMNARKYVSDGMSLSEMSSEFASPILTLQVRSSNSPSPSPITKDFRTSIIVPFDGICQDPAGSKTRNYATSLLTVSMSNLRLVYVSSSTTRLTETAEFLSLWILLQQSV
jgi:hypothetical protein